MQARPCDQRRSDRRKHPAAEHLERRDPARLKPYDVVYVQVGEARGKQAARADLRGFDRPCRERRSYSGTKPAAFSRWRAAFRYPANQLNRVVQSLRQPGSTLKPLTYLAALRKGLQPNTLRWTEPSTLPPIGRDGSARQRGFWSPRNYDGGASGRHYAAACAGKLAGISPPCNCSATGLDDSAEQGLDRVCDARDGSSSSTENACAYYPFVLGAPAVRLIDPAAFYAGDRQRRRAAPAPCDRNDRTGRPHNLPARSACGVLDRPRRPGASFYQLKSMLQGVLARGTARVVKHLSPYVGGKTGTTDNSADAWFVGFTNDVTIAIWVGYDIRRRRAPHPWARPDRIKVALPMFEPIVQAAWELHAPKTALNGPSREAMHQLVALSIDPYTGDPHRPAPAALSPSISRGIRQARTDDTQFRIVSRAESYAYRRGRTTTTGHSSSGPDDNRQYGDNRLPLPFPTWRLGRANILPGADIPMTRTRTSRDRRAESIPIISGSG